MENEWRGVVRKVEALWIRRVAVLLAAALLFAARSPLAALAEEDPEQPEAIQLEEAEAEAVPEELGGLLGPPEDDAPDPPEPTPEPTVKPTKKPDKIPWLTSFNYPEGKVNFENEIWSILTRKWGLKDYQAAGLMSSIRAESYFCPYNAQGLGGSDDRGKYLFDTGDSVGFGLCQWTSAGRKAALLRHAINHGSADLVWDFDIQMGYMGSEIDMAALKGTRNLYEAAEWAVLRYERPNQDYENSWPGTRYEMGKQIYKSHTGRDYDEPKLRFVAESDGADALDGGEIALEIGAPATLTVRSNYYWRFAQADATVDGWLEVTSPTLYDPKRVEPCVCGYACDGVKPLTLKAVKLPPAGQTWRTTLRFEIYRGGHVFKTVPVAVTCTVRDALEITSLRRLDAGSVALAAILAVTALN